MIYLTVEVCESSNIFEAARSALELSNKLYIEVRFKFNGIELSVYPTYSTRVEDKVLELASIYDRILRTKDDDSSKHGEIGTI